MKIITTTNARKNIGDIVNGVKYLGNVVAIGRRNSIDALLIPFPANYNKELNDITNINTFSKSFDFLENEPNIYSISDLKKRYV